MTDETITCPECSSTVPAAAAFCPSCGHRLAGPSPDVGPVADTAPPPPLAWSGDPTTVDTPGLHDETRVHEAVPPAAPASPWSPPTPEHEAPTGSTTPAGSAPWNPPAAPPPPAWQQPAPAAPASFGAPPPPPGGAWPPAESAAPPWGGPATATVPEHASSSSTAGSPLGGAISILGSLLVVAGIFTGWVTLDPGDGGETVTAWSLTAGDGLLKSNDPYLLLALAVAGVALGVLLLTGVARIVARLGVVAVGAAVGAVAALNWMSIADYVGDTFPSTFEATTAIGFYLVIAGGVVTALGALLPAKR